MRPRRMTQVTAVPTDVALSVANLEDGDGGEIFIPSTWREDVRVAHAHAETVEVTTKNQRWAASQHNI